MAVVDLPPSGNITALLCADWIVLGTAGAYRFLGVLARPTMGPPWITDLGRGLCHGFLV